MDQWTNEDGLISSNLTSVYQSNKGFIWVTSHNGLQRFDGVTFVSFTSNNTPFLNSNSFYRVFESNGDSLWFTTERSGLVGMANDKLFPYQHNDYIPKATITFYHSPNGEVWIGTKNSGLYRQNAGGRVAKVEGIPEVTINHINSDAGGNIWIATDGQGLYRMAADGISHFNYQSGLLSNVINHIEIDANNHVYLSTIDGVNVWRNGKIDQVDVFKGLDVNQVKIDDYGTIWVAAESGLARWNQSNQIYELFTEEMGLPGRQVSGLTFDKEGSLWVSTKKAGLVRFKVGRIYTISTHDGLTSDKINIVAKKNDTFFIGTDNGEINLLQNGAFSELVCDQEFQDAGIRDFLFDTDGNSWVVNYNGILKESGSSKKLYSYNNGLPANEVRRIFQDSQQRIWVGTRTGGLVHFREKGKSDIYDKSNGLDANYILSVEEDLKGNILVGTNAGGLTVIDKKGQVRTHHFTDDDSGILIFNTDVDQDNGYLLCTNIGLHYFKDGSFRYVPIGPEEDPKTFFDLIDDKRGSYWLTSNFGILRIDKNDLERHLETNTAFVEYELYDDNEGMLNNECTGATRSYLDEESGKIYVPTFEGVAVIDPSINLTNDLVPDVYITDLKIDDQPEDILKEKPKMEPGAFRYTFHFTSLSLLSPAKVKFLYKLEGIDKDWIGLVDYRSVEYTNLPNGHYTFKVKGSNNDGVWNEKEASLAFQVLPYFYETVWFYLACVVALAVILLLIYKWRVRDITGRNQALGKINSELDRFVYSASHDLRAPLSSTISLASIARMETSPERKDEYISLMEGCMNKMDQFISDIIDFSRNKNQEVRPEEFDIGQLISEIFDNLKYLDRAESVKAEIDIKGNSLVFSDKLRVKMVLSNLIANAIIYSSPERPDPFVNVQVEQTNASIGIKIMDNGIGIPAAEKPKVFNMFYRANDQSKGSGLGLYIVKESVEKLSGTIQLTSEEGKGTTFHIKIPKG
ncbi:MAG: two-component regulator propeller domain-containing protein [Cyclobacteriaceae bacterium]